jgi:hypothetical protein
MKVKQIVEVIAIASGEAGADETIDLDFGSDNVERVLGPGRHMDGRTRLRLVQPAMSLRIPLTVTRWSPSGRPDRVRYCYGTLALIPEELVLRRWRDRSREPSATARGVRFDGCRLPPGTWRLLRRWMEDGLSLEELTNQDVLSRHAERSRQAGLKLRAPQVTKFAAMLGFLKEKKKGVLQKVMDRPRAADKPGIPDLFLYRVDRNGHVQGGRFVEVKRWDRRRKSERVSTAQKEEIAFLRGLGLVAEVVSLLER